VTGASRLFVREFPLETRGNLFDLLVDAFWKPWNLISRLSCWGVEIGGEGEDTGLAGELAC
jgi:hypothetical protein